MPALGLTLVSFGIILALVRLKVPLWFAIFCGAISLGLFFGEDAKGLVRVAWVGVTQSTSIGLLITMVLLLTLSDAMRQTGRMQRMVTSIQAYVRRPAITLAVLPALIGLLPMPGGAIFSAPMVRQAAHGSELGGHVLSSINYWWRHIWEHWWPLYPGVILAMSLTNSDLLTFAMFQIPLGVFMVLGGVWMYRSMPALLLPMAPPPPPGLKRTILVSVAPIGVILIVWALGAIMMKFLAAHLGPGGFSPGGLSFMQKFAPLLLGLAVSLVFTLWARPFPFKQLWRLTWNKESIPLLGLVLSVMVYQNMLK